MELPVAERKLLKLLREFPWLWGIYKDWCSNDTILIHVATKEILSAKLRGLEETGKSTTEVNYWFNYREPDNQLYGVKRFGYHSLCSRTLAGTVEHEFNPKRTHSSVQLLHLAEMERVRDRDSDKTTHSVTIYRPSSEKNLYEMCLEAYREQK